jgi:hypothetical protein
MTQRNIPEERNLIKSKTLRGVQIHHNNHTENLET